MKTLYAFLFILALVLPTQSWGAITEVGGGTQRAQNTCTSHSCAVAFPGSVTSGNFLVAVGPVYRNDSAVTASVTGSRCTYTVIRNSFYDVNDEFWIAYCIATSSGAETVTFDVGGVDAGDSISFAVDEFTQGGGNQIVSSVDGGVSIGTGPADAADSLTTLTANELIIAVMNIGSPGTPTITPTGGLTQIGEQESTSVEAFNAAFQVATTATTYTPTWTVNTVGAWGAATASFKEIAGGGGPSGPPVGTLNLLGVGR